MSEAEAVAKVYIDQIREMEADRADLVLLTSYMSDQGYTAESIAYAVEKPAKHADVLAEARAWVEKSMPDSPTH